MTIPSQQQRLNAGLFSENMMRIAHEKGISKQDVAQILLAYFECDPLTKYAATWQGLTVVNEARRSHE